MTLVDADEAVGVPVTPALYRRLDKAGLTLMPSTAAKKSRGDVWLATEEWREDALRSDELFVSLVRLKRTAQKQALSEAELKSGLKPAHRPAFAAAFKERQRLGRWPEGVGVFLRKSAFVLLVADLMTSRRREQASPPSNGGSFAARFEALFNELDRQHGSHNRVALRDLRPKMADVDRASFDRELNALRAADRFVLEDFEGRHGSFDPTLAEAGITELGHRYVFVARKRHA
jgi:hypothetical protein